MFRRGRLSRTSGTGFKTANKRCGGKGIEDEDDDENEDDRGMRIGSRGICGVGRFAGTQAY